jgi:hypothetical protein
MNGKFKLYCDMDGVLVDFVAGIVPYLNKKVYEPAPEGATAEYRDLHARARVEACFAPIRIAHLEKYKCVFNHDWVPRYPAIRRFMDISAGDDREFWANLEWMPGGKELWDYVKVYEPDILSAPMREPDGPGAMGKLDWVKRELGLEEARINLSSSKKEYGAPGAILIDDRDKYIEQFTEGGGTAVRHVEPTTTIEELRELLFERYF